MFRVHLPQRSVISLVLFSTAAPRGLVPGRLPNTDRQEKRRCTLARCDGEIHRQSPIIPRRPPNSPPQRANRPDNPGHRHFSLRVRRQWPRLVVASSAHNISLWSLGSLFNIRLSPAPNDVTSSLNVLCNSTEASCLQHLIGRKVPVCLVYFTPSSR
jgi:hypothetical protein